VPESIITLGSGRRALAPRTEHWGVQERGVLLSSKVKGTGAPKSNRSQCVWGSVGKGGNVCVAGSVCVCVCVYGVCVV